MKFQKIKSFYKKVREKILIKDSVLLGLVSGLIATVTMDGLDFLLWYTKKTEFLRGQLAGTVITKKFKANEYSKLLLGELLHSIAAIGAGVPLVYVLRKTGKDHHLIKGAYTGFFLWGLIYVVGKRIGLFKRPNLIRSHYITLFIDLVYGMTLSKSMILLADPSVFPEKKEPSVSKP